MALGDLLGVVSFLGEMRLTYTNDGGMTRQINIPYSMPPFEATAGKFNEDEIVASEVDHAIRLMTDGHALKFMVLMASAPLLVRLFDPMAEPMEIKELFLWGNSNGTVQADGQIYVTNEDTYNSVWLQYAAVE